MQFQSGLNRFYLYAVLFLAFNFVKLNAVCAENTVKRFDYIEGVTFVIKNSDSITGDGDSQILIERTGAPSFVLATLDALEFTDILKGDLDGDQELEIIAVACSRSGDDKVPFIFSSKDSFKQIFPPGIDEFPVMGKEIALTPYNEKLFLTVKCIVDYYDLGTPNLFVNEFYILENCELKKIREELVSGDHFNQKINEAVWCYRKGDSKNAEEMFQNILSSYPADLSQDIYGEIVFYKAEIRNKKKDFSSALKLYETFLASFPNSVLASEAKKQSEFLSRHSNVDFLATFTEINSLKSEGKAEEALAMLRKGKESVASDSIYPDYLVLEGELLLALGRLEEALEHYREIKSLFPKSEIASFASITMIEIQGEQDHENQPENATASKLAKDAIKQKPEEPEKIQASITIATTTAQINPEEPEKKQASESVKVNSGKLETIATESVRIKSDEPVKEQASEPVKVKSDESKTHADEPVKKSFQDKSKEPVL
ncbi:MAG: tetratricopeptide repeat protein [Candidatus Riflebacteria bacterium]|nr:tetratricopeptide repeat protein [Candidatus Riflebacteria bacterium]